MRNARLNCVALDRDHLSHNTFGDEKLLQEVIVLFNTQIAMSRRHISAYVQRGEWVLFTHTLKGAASAIGAMQFHQLASEFEASGPPIDEDQAFSMLRAYDATVEAFKSEAAKHL